MSAGKRHLAITVVALLIACPGALRAQNSDDDLKKQVELLAARVRVLEEALRVKTQEEGARGDHTRPQAVVDDAVAPHEHASAQAADIGQTARDEAAASDAPTLQGRVDALDAEVERLGYAQTRGSGTLSRLDGIGATGSVTTFMQGVAGQSRAAAAGANGVDASFSGDLAIDVPFGAYGHALARTLVGQGRGVTHSLPPLFSSPNADLEKHGDGLTIAELWYEATFPYPSVVDKRFSIAVGKMDPRRFFDANAAANNQRQQFLADTFVNNLTVDWGGDDNGYGLGTRLGWRFTSAFNQALTVVGQLGVFEVGGDPMDYFGGPFVIGELDVTQRSYGLLSHYRFYAWTNNGDHPDYTEVSTGHQRGNRGLGASIDRQLSGDLTVFGRYGWQDPAVSRFDHAITAGGRIVGDRWGRGGDILGFAAGYSRASRKYALVSEQVDGVNVSGGETYLETYYSYFLDSGFRIAPDVQYIRRPGAIGGTRNPFVFALRAQFDF